MDFAFLKYVDDNPRTVLIALLGLLTTGSLAGGLYVQTLHFSLEERDRLFGARLQLLEDQGQSDMRSLRVANTVLRQQSEIIAQATRQAESGLRDLYNILSQRGNSTRIDRSSETRVLSAAQSVQDHLKVIGQSVERSGETLRLIESLKISNANEVSLQPVYELLRDEIRLATIPVPESSNVLVFGAMPDYLITDPIIHVPEPSNALAFGAGGSLIACLALGGLLTRRRHVRF